MVRPSRTQAVSYYAGEPLSVAFVNDGRAPDSVSVAIMAVGPRGAKDLQVGQGSGSERAK